MALHLGHGMHREDSLDGFSSYQSSSVSDIRGHIPSLYLAVGEVFLVPGCGNSFQEFQYNSVIV